MAYKGVAKVTEICPEAVPYGFPVNHVAAAAALPAAGVPDTQLLTVGWPSRPPAEADMKPGLEVELAA